MQLNYNSTTTVLQQSAANVGHRGMLKVRDNLDEVKLVLDLEGSFI